MLIPVPLPSNFGARLRTVRLSHMLAQGVAAKRLQVSQPYLCRVEKGRAVAGRDLLLKCMEVYGEPHMRYAFGFRKSLPLIRIQPPRA